MELFYFSYDGRASPASVASSFHVRGTSRRKGRQMRSYLLSTLCSRLTMTILRGVDVLFFKKKKKKKGICP